MDGYAPTNEEKGAEKLMDEYLKSIGLHRKKIAKDGSCLFRAVAEQVLHSQTLHTKVRGDCVEFLAKNRDSYEAFIEGDYDEYLSKIQDPQHWVGEVEINALAVMYRRDFLIYQEPHKCAVSITDNGFTDKVQLCFLNGNHYDSVYPISHVKAAAFCQSILYDLLYESVFKVERTALTASLRGGRTTELSDDNMAVCPSSDESDSETHQHTWGEDVASTTANRYNSQQHCRGRGRGLFLSERVRRALNPNLLRNIEYDVWFKTKRAQQKMDFYIAAGLQYTVGGRCQVHLDNQGRSFNATIKEVSPNNGPVTVYVEELGEIHSVRLCDLSLHGEDDGWRKMVSRDKRLSNEHGAESGRGRWRGKPSVMPSGPSCVNQAADLGAPGRVQKQHSWSPQTPVQEQAKTRTSRSSTSSVEGGSFGLTDKERLFREEEQRSAALLELQLCDEQSFPALGTPSVTQSEVMVKKKKKAGQKNRNTSPVDAKPQTTSPPAGERPKSSSSQLSATTTATSANTTNNAVTTTTTASNTTKEPHEMPTAALSQPPAPGPVLQSKIKAAPPNLPNTTVAVASVKTKAPSTGCPSGGGASDAPPVCTAPPVKTNGSVIHVAPPLSVSPSVVPPAPKPTASCSVAPPHPSVSPLLSSPSSVPALPSSLSPPTFIAPIAPSPVTAQGFLSHTSSVTYPALPRSSPPLSSNHPSSSSVLRPAAAVNHLPSTPAHSPDVLSDGSTLAVISPQSPPTSHPTPQPPATSPQPAVHQPQATSPPPQPTVPLSQGAVTHHEPQASFFHPAPGAPLPLCPTQLPPHSQLNQSHQPQSELQTSSTSMSPPSPPSQLPHRTPHLHSHSLPHLSQVMPGLVPLQQLSQLFQDPLYPGFPQGEGGDMAMTPSYSHSRAGEDLPRDVSVLRWFFNLGVKAYSNPMFSPYMYLFPLQQSYTLQRNPPHYQPTSPPPAPHHVSPQAPPPGPAHHSDSPFTQIPLPLSCPSFSGQQVHLAPNTPSCPSGYSTSHTSLPSSRYPPPQPFMQGYPMTPGPPVYAASIPQYPSSLQGYPAQTSLGEQPQPASVEPPPGRVPTPQEGSAAANVANANGSCAVSAVSAAGLANLQENHQGEIQTRAVLLVDPPLNNMPIFATPGNVSLGYQSQPANPVKSYVPLGAEPNLRYGPPLSGGAPLSVGCSMEEDWSGLVRSEPISSSQRGRRYHDRPQGAERGGRGRGASERGRGGFRRKQGGGEEKVGLNHVQFNPSVKLRGRGRGY
ncbi:OTU domain-containing protein 4 [Lampris incognitus]|uniref:OTU domain-containing protein 4 n=1 Tax=Lampris incognitus TaxID=2546036 RepID=UPI0024B4CE0D|nr:OTU domain-containing protein 4 [Lampris incognitus]